MADTRDDDRLRYKREYQLAFRKEHTRLEITLTKAQHGRLSAEAARHGMKRSAFVREALFAYLDRRYLVPDPDVVRNLELGVRRIGTNVNQLARHVNTERVAKVADVEGANKLLVELEELISSAFRKPPEE